MPEGLTSQQLKEEAALKGLLIECGDSLFMGNDGPKNYIRLGFSAINSSKISEGLVILGELIKQLTPASKVKG